LNPKHARLYAAVNPDTEATSESVAAFAAEYGLTTSPEPVAPAPVEAAPTFAPTLAPGGAPPVAVITDPKDALGILQRDPAEYMRLRETGRIALAKPGSE
jgi:hypothetical protein